MAQREAIQQETIQQETTRQEAPQHDGEAPQANLRLAIEGMHCANCAANIEKHYRATPGVVDVGVEAQEVQTVAQREDVCLFIQLQPALGQVLPDHHQGLLQPFLALTDDVEVVHISAVIPEEQLVFAEVIPLIQI